MFAYGISLLFLSASSVAATPIPDFTVKMGIEEISNMGAWLIELNPPANHHFNIDAPLKVATKRGHVFSIEAKEKMLLGFRSNAPDPHVSEGDIVVASAFLCDDAKTYCVKKQLEFPLKANSDLKKRWGKNAGKTNSNPKAKNRLGGGEVLASKKTEAASAKDQEGFWNNRPEQAIAESKKTGKPLLIDFYGIWCPPCNLYNEQVFSKSKFKKIASRFVLLKMDADRETSFELKSKYKIGGYPTILITDSNGEEIERVVGFFPLSEFVSILERAAQGKAAGQPDLKKQVKVALEKRETAEAFKKAMAGLESDPKNGYFQVVKLKLESADHPEVLKKDETQRNVADWISQAKQFDSDTLLELQGLVVSHADAFAGGDTLKKLHEVYHQLALRVSPETLSISGTEVSVADLDGMKMEWAEKLKDDLLIKEIRADAIQSYRKLMKKFNAEDSKGYNVELAYYLWNDGKVKEARAIYDRMIKKYPSEFTFYFSAANMFLKTKDLKNAHQYASQAVKHAYGDNLIRATERFLRVLIAQGEKRQAVIRGEEFLKAHPKLSGLSVRTNRYLDSIEKAVKDAQQ